MKKENTELLEVRRDYKDTIFRRLFSEKEALLSLYNAILGANYTNVDELEIVTLENAVYMNMRNDVAFVVDCSLNLYEHQSTYNPNMPLRNLFYVSKELSMLVDAKTLYRRSLVKIPAPRFIVFYNGTENQPEQKYLRLSDAFACSVDEPELELVVTVLNINHGKNKALLEQCRILKEYVMYTEKVRKYIAYMSLNEAVERAVQESINEGILADFLRKNRKEAIEVSIFEYNEELVIQDIRKDEFRRGKEEGVEEGIEQGIEQGEKQLALLYKKLLADGRTADLERVADDAAYRKKLYEEYDIMSESEKNAFMRSANGECRS